MPSVGWVYGTVHDITQYDSYSCLPLRNAPGGDILYTYGGKPMGWQNGESALIQPSPRSGRWIRANWNGTDGWTDANYVWY